MVNSLTKKYCILEFVEPDGSKCSELVPSAWVCVKSFECSWPPRSGSNIKSLVRKAAVPKHEWTKCVFSRILGQYDDYRNACQKLTKSLDTSTLESESDGINRKKPRRSQKRKPAAASESSSSDNLDSESSGENESGHPKISGTLLSKQKLPRYSGGVGVKCDPADPNHQFGNCTFPTSSFGVGSTAFGQETILTTTDSHYREPFLHEVTSLPETKIEQQSHSIGIVNDSTHRSGPIFFEESGNSPNEHDSILNQPLTEDEVGNPEYSLASGKDIAAFQNQFTEFAKRVLHLLEKQSEEIQEVKAHLHSIRQGGSAVLPDFTRIPPLPIANSEDLEALEEWLALEANRKLLSDYLGLVGGHTVEKNTRKVLKKLISQPLSRMINFTGKGDKIALGKLRLLEVLKDGIRVGKPTAQDDVIEQSACNWFRFSKNRKYQHSQEKNGVPSRTV